MLSTRLSHPLSVKLSSTEVKLATGYSRQLSHIGSCMCDCIIMMYVYFQQCIIIGISFSTRADGVLVHSVPTVLMERTDILAQLVQDLLVQHVAVSNKAIML